MTRIKVIEGEHGKITIHMPENKPSEEDQRKLYLALLGCMVETVQLEEKDSKQKVGRDELKEVHI